MLYRRREVGVLQGLLHQNIASSSSYKGLTARPLLVFVTTTFRFIFTVKNIIVPPVKIRFQGAQLRISLVETGAHALRHVPGAIPLGC